MSVNSIKFDFWVLVFSLTAVRAPMLIESANFRIGFTMIAIIPLCIVIFKNIVFKGLLMPYRNGIFWPSSFLFLLVFIAFFRGQIEGVLVDGFLERHIFWWTIVLLFGVSLFLIPRSVNELSFLRRGIYYCLGVYVIFNVILWLLGIEMQRKVLVWDDFGKASFLASLGIDAMRVSFATASGPGPFSVIAGIVVLIGGAIFINRRNYKKKVRIAWFIIFVFGLAGLLLSDTRTTILWVMVAPILVYIFRGRLRPIFKYFPVGYLIFPIFLIGVATIVSTMSIGTSMSRSGSISNIATLSNRTFIWAHAVNELSEFKLIHLVGFGIHGQVTSGVGSGISEISGKNFIHNPSHKTTHNVVLQSILDIGYIGLLVVIVVMVRLFNLVSRMSTDRDRNLHELFLIFLILAGTTEAAPTVYTNEISTVVILFLISFFRHNNTSKGY